MPTRCGPAWFLVVAALAALLGTARAQSTARPPAEALLDRAVLKALDEELSGVAAKRHVSRLAQWHRVPASPGFHGAVEYVMEHAKAVGLSDVHVETFPSDGMTWFGTLRGNRGWRVEAGWLEEVTPQPRRITSLDDVGLAVADNSESADVTAEVVDVGGGAEAADYEGKEVRGRLVLCDALPSACHRQAVETRGAVGLVSYNSNQVSAWWRDDQDLVRWGHLDGRGRHNTFAVMISLREARGLQRRLAHGERITLHAVVRARNDESMPYETLVASLPGKDPAGGEIVFSCHLDHEKPGANDNASGCAAILEIARTLKTLVDTRRIPPPTRTIRFVWPSEMTGTIAYLVRHPDVAARIRAAVHLDMVGGDPFVTKSVLHVTRAPWSLATVTDDVAEVFGRYVMEGSQRAAGEGDMTRAIRSPTGSKDALWADITPYESGSDHWIYQEGGFGIPAIYLRDHPDVYIHTTGDLPDHIEPTKIKRSAFIAAASGYYLATMPDGGGALLKLSYADAYERLAEDARRAAAMAGRGRDIEATNLVQQAVRREQRRLRSVSRFADLDGARIPVEKVDRLCAGLGEAAKEILSALGLTGGETAATSAVAVDKRVPLRNPDVKGPLSPDGPWLTEKAGPGAATIALKHLPASDDLTYEIVNFIDGKRSVSEIRDAVSAEFEPLDLKAVSEFVDLLAQSGAVTFRK